MNLFVWWAMSVMYSGSKIALPGGTVTNTLRFCVSDTTATPGITQHQTNDQQTFTLWLFALVRSPVPQTAPVTTAPSALPTHS